MILASPSFLFSLFTSYTHTHTLHSLTTLHPFALHTSPLLPSSSLAQACSLVYVLMSLQFFIGDHFLFPDLLGFSTVSAGLAGCRDAAEQWAPRNKKSDGNSLTSLGRAGAHPREGYIGPKR